MPINNDEPTHSDTELWQAHQAAQAQIESMQAQRERDFREICMLIGLIADKNTIIDDKDTIIKNLRIANNALSDKQSQLKSAETGRLSSTYQRDGGIDVEFARWMFNAGTSHQFNADGIHRSSRKVMEDKIEAWKVQTGDDIDMCLTCKHLYTGRDFNHYKLCLRTNSNVDIVRVCSIYEKEDNQNEQIDG